MRQRGRKSVAALAVDNVVPLREPADPPEHLTPEQAETWRAVMKSTAGGFIAPEAFPVLVEYCRAISDSDDVARVLNAFEESWIKEAEGFKRWKDVLAMREKISARIASLSVKLRISPSTRILPRGAGRAEARGLGKPKPWES